MVQTLDEMVLLITKEKKEEAMRSEATGSLYIFLLSHVQHLKLTSCKERNLLQAEVLAKQLNMDSILGSDAQRAASASDQTPAQKPQNVIRFIEKALKAQRAISDFDRE